MSLITQPIILDETGQKIASSIRSLSEDAFTIQDNAAYHNSIFRGISLGTEVTNDQYLAIKNGTFENMFIGDYWTINNINWRIAHFNYWIGTGDIPCIKNHIIIIPDSNLTSAKMNSSNITTGGYTGSGFYTGINADETTNTGYETAKTAFINAFGAEHLLNHRELFVNAVSGGTSSGWAWYNSTVDLMNETMVYGHSVWSKNFRDVGIDKTILALFKLAPEFINKSRNWFWLRSVCSAALFCGVSTGGAANGDGASSSFGVRPAAGICAEDEVEEENNV